MKSAHDKRGEYRALLKRYKRASGDEEQRLGEAINRILNERHGETMVYVGKFKGDR